MESIRTESAIQSVLGLYDFAETPFALTSIATNNPDQATAHAISLPTHYQTTRNFGGELALALGSRRPM